MDKRFLKGIKPAPFPNSSLSEQDSADIFHSLVDRRYIRGNVTVMDKIPNTDGVLTFIDADQYPIGQFEVQLKTLASQYKDNPKFQCELALLAYALDAILPVILVVVDQQSKLVYWLHLDELLISKINPKGNAKSVMLPLPTDQVIDGKDLGYVSSWKSIIDSVKYKLTNFNELLAQRNAFRTLLGGDNPRLLPAYSLNPLSIREIHVFLDLLNSKMDNEFRSIKEMLYYHYWKMAIAIAVYQPEDLAFFILPLPLSSNSPLILEIADPSRPFMDDLFDKDKALIMMHTPNNLIKEDPKMLALELINNEVFKVVGKRNFPIEDRFMAEEYVYGFAKRFSSLLGISRSPDHVNVQHILRTIFLLVPLSREVMHGRSTEHIIMNIDHLMSVRDEEHKTMIAQAERALEEGMTANPNLRLSMRTGLFELDLLRYYLELLDGLGVKSFKRPLLDMKDNNAQGNFTWSSWNLENIYSNAAKIFESFPDLYNRLVNERFPQLKAELDLFQQDSVIVYILASSYQGDKPRMLCYRFIAIDATPIRKLLLFRSDDSDCPDLLGDDAWKTMWNRTFEFFGTKHELRAKSGLPLEIFMGSSPMHRLISDTLGRYLDEYLKSQGLKKTDYREFTAYE